MVVMAALMDIILTTIQPPQPPQPPPNQRHHLILTVDRTNLVVGILDLRPILEVVGIQAEVLILEVVGTN